MKTMRCMSQAELNEAINREHEDPPWEVDAETPDRIPALEAELQFARAAMLVMATRNKQLHDERDYLLAALREACPAAIALPIAGTRVMPAQAMRTPRPQGWVSMR